MILITVIFVAFMRAFKWNIINLNTGKQNLEIRNSDLLSILMSHIDQNANNNKCWTTLNYSNILLILLALAFFVEVETFMWCWLGE